MKHGESLHAFSPTPRLGHSPGGARGQGVVGDSRAPILRYLANVPDSAWMAPLPGSHVAATDRLESGVGAQAVRRGARLAAALRGAIAILTLALIVLAVALARS